MISLSLTVCATTRCTSTIAFDAEQLRAWPSSWIRWVRDVDWSRVAGLVLKDEGGKHSLSVSAF
jgi:hypothetical protein